MATRSTPGTLGVPPAAAVRGRVLCDSAHYGGIQSCRGFQSDRIFLLLALPGLRVGGGASPFGIGALDRNQESAIDLLQPMVRGTLFSGTDVGGSVRIPSAYCGISALKPTLGRLAADSANLEFVLHNSWQCGCATVALTHNRLASLLCEVSAVAEAEIDCTRPGEHFTPYTLGLMARSAKELQRGQ